MLNWSTRARRGCQSRWTTCFFWGVHAFFWKSTCFIFEDIILHFCGHHTNISIFFWRTSYFILVDIMLFKGCTFYDIILHFCGHHSLFCGHHSPFHTKSHKSDDIILSGLLLLRHHSSTSFLRVVVFRHHASSPLYSLFYGMFFLGHHP